MANSLNSLIIEGKITEISRNGEEFSFIINTQRVVKNSRGVKEIENYKIPVRFPNKYGELLSIDDEVRIVGLLRQKHFSNNYPLVFVQAEHIDLKPKKSKGGRK